MTDQVRPHNVPIKVYKIDSSLKLRSKQEAFVYEYLIDYNATQAAIRAGYAKNTAASIGAENLRKLHIAQAVHDGHWFYQYQNGIDADWIRKERIKLYHRCMQEEPVMVWDKENKEYVHTGEYVFKEVTAKGVLADMAKDAGMDIATVNVNQSGTINHEHTVKDQMNFSAIKQKVDKHKDAVH